LHELSRTARGAFVALALLGLAAKTSCTSYKLTLGDDGGTGGGDGGTGGGYFDAGDGILPDAGFEVCADVGRQVELSPLDLFILLDVSGSMDYDNKWVAVSGAMKNFITRPDFSDLAVAIQYFPLRLQCDASAYQVPAVPFDLLPNNAAAIGASLDEQRMQGGTPTVPALEGTMGYVKSYLSQSPDAGRKAALVLATDGVPDNSCVGVSSGLLNNLENVATVAGNAATSDPPVKTFVIGVGKDLGALDLIADAGGTQKAILVDVAGNADVQFLNALTQIRRDALDCSFQVPGANDITRDKARVRFVPDDGTLAFGVPQVPTAGDCMQGPGWFFDDPTMPTKLTLCDATCEAVSQGKTGRLYIEFACGVN
jgi:hypothetical protein